MTETKDTHAAAMYARDGYYFTDTILDAEVLGRTREHMDDVLHCIYETGVSPPAIGTQGTIQPVSGRLISPTFQIERCWN